MFAADIMTREVLTVDETSTLAEALAMMSDQTIRHLPVVDRNATLVGIISASDLRRFGLSGVTDMQTLDELKARLRRPIAEYMSADVLSVEPETNLVDVIDVMVDERVGALPVVDPEDDRLVGIVSYIDVLRAARDQLMGE